MSYRYLLAALLLSFTASAANAQDTTGWPEWLREAMASEARKLKSREVRSDDEQYRFKLAGKLKSSSAFDGGWYFESDIQSESPLECYIFTEDMDLATLVNNLAEANIEAQVEANGGPVDNRNLFALDAGTIDGAPYHAIEWIYTLGQAPNALVGFTKIRAAINGNTTQACSHNYVGYRQTFADAFDEFVRTIELPEPADVPYYEEVAVQTLGDQNIGVIQLSLTGDADGDTEIRMVSSTLIPVAPGQVATDDSTSLSWSTPDGRLINALTATSENGEVVTNLQLSRDEVGDWNVTGMFKGKEINEVIDGDLAPVSDLGAMQAVRSLFDGDAAATAFPLWVSDADPTQFVEGRVVRDDAEIARQATLELGPMSLSARFDENGSATDAEMNIGAAVITINRTWSRGAIP